MQRQMDMMQTMITQVCQLVNNSNPAPSRPRQGQNRSGRRNPNQCKYCWTHGLCNHLGIECRSKAEGHKDTATLENRMGGSTKNVPTQ